MELFNNICLIAAIVICCGALYKNYELLSAPANKKGSKKKALVKKEIPQKVYLILLGIIILVALFIRIYKFGSVPGGFNQDGAMAAVDGKALADYGTDRYGMKLPVHLTAWGYGQMSALLSYLMVPFIKLFGLSPITARLPQLIVSIAGLVCLYLFTKDVFGKKAALITAAFAAINPWHILQSRWALDCNLYPHFFIMGIYFLHKGLNKRLHLVISMIMFGLCMYCYGISIYTMPVFLLISCIYLLVTKKLRIIDAVIALIVYLLVAWPFIAVMVINFFKLDSIETPLFTIPYFSESVRSNDILFFSDSFFAQLKENIKAMLDVTLLQKKDLPWNDIEGFGTMYLFSMPFAVTGIIALIKDHRKNTGAVLSLIFLITGILAGILTNSVNINRINIVYYPIIIMSAIGILYVIEYLEPVQWGIAVVYCTAFVVFCGTYFTTYAKSMESYFFKDFGDAVSSLKDSDADKFYITADSQYEGASNVSEILTLFYLDIDAHYYQGKTEENGLTFDEKYTFKSIKNINIDPSENAEYVITSKDTKYFDKNKFNFEQFGSYYTVTPK